MLECWSLKTVAIVAVGIISFGAWTVTIRVTIQDRKIVVVVIALTRIAARNNAGFEVAMHTKIPITPQMREFNDAVQEADALTDGQFDQEPAVVLLERLHQMKIYPHSARHLAEAIAGVAVKR